MTSDTNVALSGEGGRLRAIALLERYPSLEGHELKELRNWFLRQATALDVGMVASEHHIRENYKAFRNQNLDRFTMKDAVIALLMIMAVVLLAVLAYSPG